jgi:hypothetical protein
VQPELNE